MATTSSLHPHVEAEPVEELLGGLQGEVVLFLDEPTDEIGQAAVGERDVTGPLEDDDLRSGIKPAQTGSGGHAPGHAADDDDALGCLGHLPRDLPSHVGRPHFGHVTVRHIPPRVSDREVLSNRTT